MGALDATVRAAGSKSGPGLSAAMDAGDLAPNRFRLGAGMVQSSTGFHGALNHGVLPLPVRHRLLSENTADTSDTGAVDSPTTDGLGIFGDVGELPNGPSLNLSGAYCVQKMSSGRAAYALFWAVGAAGTCTLAAVVG